jgi:PAS domain S-box-containing protein
VRGPDGATRGFLIAAFYPQQFVRRLPITLPPNADVTVIDDHGVVLYDSSPEDTPTALKDSTSVQAVLGGQIVRIAGPADLGDDEARFGALVPIPRLGWAVGYTLPLGAVETALAWRTWAQAGGIALVILAAAGVFVVIARRLTRPLSMLAETADAIARGEQPSVPEIESATEVQQLALAMQVMSAAVAQREDALRESETRLRLAVEAAPVVLFNHDRALRYTWVGKALAGLAPDALLGKTDAELFSPDIAEAAMAVKRRALETGGRAEAELDLPADAAVENSPPRRWELTAEPLRDAGGDVTGITCAALDVTERRALERMQQEFISLVSHELRNPLASVKGYAQLMQRRGEFNERAIRSIVEQSDHLDRLISDLLDSSRAEAGRLELRRRRINLVDVVNASIERIQAQTEHHRIRLDSSEHELFGLWDPQRLDQVFSNLLTNAVKYSPDGGEIVVRLERQGSDAHVAIQDQGVGIEQDQLPRIFDRFYRVTATAPSIQGLGIGLYVARELVEAHGGRIWAESAGPGQGATLHVLLALDAQPPPGPPNARPVLVVDDDEPLRELIVDTLRDEGYHLAVARDGLEALERVATDPPALILLDWMMPRLNGEGFATALRQRHPTLDVPIVVMTAGGVAHERAASIGAHGFINKPFELAVLLDQVARHLGPRAADA